MSCAHYVKEFEQSDGCAVSHYISVKAHILKSKTEREQCCEGTLDHRTAVRSLADKCQPVSTQWMDSDAPVDKSLGTYPPKREKRLCTSSHTSPTKAKLVPMAFRGLSENPLRQV